MGSWTVGKILFGKKIDRGLVVSCWRGDAKQKRKQENSQKLRKTSFQGRTQLSGEKGKFGQVGGSKRKRKIHVAVRPRVNVILGSREQMAMKKRAILTSDRGGEINLGKGGGGNGSFTVMTGRVVKKARLIYGR